MLKIEQDGMYFIVSNYYLRFLAVRFLAVRFLARLPPVFALRNSIIAITGEWSEYVVSTICGLYFSLFFIS
jgi:hypothetical protein